MSDIGNERTNVAVSIIVPIYNTEKYLPACLDSILAQTHDNLEIILIDDGSTDGSAEICKKYLSDSRVIYYRKENEGLAAARADGIARASGEYLGFVDSDDWIKPEMYEKMYADIQIAKKIELIKKIRLSTLQDMKEFYSEDELLERADSVLSDISLLCHDIYLTKN